jgi:hypothetical protein
VLLLGPRWLVAHDTNTRALNAEQRAKATNDVRATLLQAVGGLLLLVGAVGTFRQLTVSREGQVTERFTRAIDQLGSDKHQLDVTLGGIYALERIAKDSPADQTTIAEILTAYVCGHAPWPPTLPGQPPEDTPAGEARECPPDVQAAMTVLGRMPRPTGERHRLLLRRVDLRGVDLSGANLRGATLLGAHLEGAILLQTQLDGADLRFTHLDGAYLGQAHLDGAYLREACLERAHLVGAYLEGANLEGAKLQGAYMQDARANAATIWPDGRNSDATAFNWKAARIKL